MSSRWPRCSRRGRSPSRRTWRFSRSPRTSPGSQPRSPAPSRALSRPSSRTWRRCPRSRAARGSCPRSSSWPSSSTSCGRGGRPRRRSPRGRGAASTSWSAAGGSRRRGASRSPAAASRSRKSTITRGCFPRWQSGAARGAPTSPGRPRSYRRTACRASTSCSAWSASCHGFSPRDSPPSKRSGCATRCARRTFKTSAPWRTATCSRGERSAPSSGISP